MNDFRSIMNAVVGHLVTETEAQFTNEQVPGWYLVDGGEVADGPFDDEAQAQERAAYPSEKAQYWDGHQWAQTGASSGMLPDGTEVTIKIGNVDQGRTGVIQGEDDSDPDAGTEWARYRIEFPDGGHIYKKKHQFNVVGMEEGVMEAPTGKKPNPDNLGALAAHISREFATTAADCQQYTSQDRSYSIGGNFNAASSGKVVIDRNVHMPGSYNTSTYFNEVLKIGTSIKGAKPLDIIRELFQKIAEKAKVYGLEKLNVSHDALYFDVGVATMQVMYEVGSNYMWIGYNWLSKAKTESVSEASDHDHTDDCEVCSQDLMELPDIEDGIIEGVDELDEGMFDTKKSKYFPEATDLDDGHAVDMAWEWILVDLREHPQADESEIYRFVMSTQAEKELSDKDAQFIRLRAEEYIANGGRLGEAISESKQSITVGVLMKRIHDSRTMSQHDSHEAIAALNAFGDANTPINRSQLDQIVALSGVDDLYELASDLVDSSMEESLNHMGEHEFQSFGSWRAACKARNPNVWFDGDRDIANAMVGPKPFIQGETISMGEWDGEVGVIYAPMQEATVDRNKNIKQNQSSDLLTDIQAKDDDGNEIDSSMIDRLKQLAGLK